MGPGSHAFLPDFIPARSVPCSPDAASSMQAPKRPEACSTSTMRHATARLSHHGMKNRVWRAIVPTNCTTTISKRGMRPEAIRWTISFARCDSIRVNTRMESVREPPSLMVGSSLMRRTRNDCFQCEDSLASPIANGTCVRKRLEFRTPPIRCIRRKSCSLNASRILGTMSNGYQET